MLQVELLRDLQSVDDEIKGLQRILHDRTMVKELGEIKREYSEQKEGYIGDMRKLSRGRELSQNLDEELKKLDEKLTKSNRRLYGDGVDLKMIGCLQRDIESFKEKIDGIESELLSIMEDNEKLNSEAADKKRRLSELKSSFNSLKSKYTDQDKEVRNRIEELSGKRSGMAERIDRELMRRYDEIAHSVADPVAEVVSGVCTGCGVRLNSMLCAELARDQRILYCEHCGRILYSRRATGI